MTFGLSSSGQKLVAETDDLVSFDRISYKNTPCILNIR